VQTTASKVAEVFKKHVVGGNGDPFYVSNMFEELDSTNKRFLDKKTHTLYFMPNDTMLNVIVASQIPCIISMSA
jgi:hypothetical protein